MLTYEEHVQAAAASMPPLTPAQLAIIVPLLSEKKVAYTPPSKSEKEIKLEEMRAELAKLPAKMQKAMNRCHMCDLEEKVHYFQKGYGMGFHDFIPLTPDDVIDVAQSYKETIDELKAEIAEVESSDD